MIFKDKKIYFQNYDKTDVPYISLDVQGIPLNLIVDTGCAVSIISKKALEKLNHEESKKKVSLIALTPDAVPSDMVNIPFKINNKDVVEEFVVYDQDDIGGFEVKYGITIHGILSNEFCDRMRCKIDFKNHCVIFP